MIASNCADSKLHRRKSKTKKPPHPPILWCCTQQGFCVRSINSTHSVFNVCICSSMFTTCVSIWHLPFRTHTPALLAFDTCVLSTCILQVNIHPTILRVQTPWVDCLNWHQIQPAALLLHFRV